MKIACFAPVANPTASTLILGSMPGAVSLAANEYYAHPRNLFWPFMEAIFGIARAAPYRERCAGLKRHGLALWDVLQFCERPGSLDAAIVESSIVVNDFARFLRCHPRLQTVCFNGAKAEQSFCRYVDPAAHAALRLVRLPSTSPANASISVAQKLDLWREALAG